MDWSISYTINLNTGVTTAIIEPVSLRQSINASLQKTTDTTDALTPLTHVARFFGIALLAIGLGGITGPLIPSLRLESAYAFSNVHSFLTTHYQLLTTKQSPPPLPASAPVVFTPLVDSAGNTIEPVNQEFSLVVPSVGINAPIVEGVDPANTTEYQEALKTGIAHASTSFLPNEDGTVYLFSHSTNYDWFVKDLNAVFYLLKNLKIDDLIVVVYKDKQYTYKLRETKVVKPSEISYLVPESGKKSLILQTCWPPGSVAERLLLFADLVESQ